jgi:16S rRNA (guanine527-N7)-methyltransferase
MELVRWNERYALLSRADVRSVFTKHVAASLGALLLVRPSPNEEWVDVGSGAGLPGLVLKIWSPEQRITLIDGSRKKCMFLQNTALTLDLDQVSVLCTRVETLVARDQNLGKFDVLFARAVAELAVTLLEFGPLLRPGGRILTFKGPSWATEVESARSSGVLDAFGRLHETVRVPWAPAHILSIVKHR